MKSRKRQRNRTTKSRKNKNAWWEGYLQILGNVRSGHHQTCGYERTKIKKEYLRRTRRLIETKLNRRNFIKGINSPTVVLVRCSGPFLKWTKEEKKNSWWCIRPSIPGVDRLYVSRKEGGRGLARIQESDDASMQWLQNYIKKREGRLITAIRNNKDNSSINRTKIMRKQKWDEKQLYEHIERQINEISHEKSWTWLRIGNLKRETESLQIATQNNAIKNNYFKTRIDKTQQHVGYVVIKVKRFIT